MKSSFMYRVNTNEIFFCVDLVQPDIDVLGLTYRDAIHQERQGSIRRHFQNEKSCARILVIISQQTISSETLNVYTNRVFLKQMSRVAGYLFPEQKMHFLYPYTHSLVINSKYDRY